MKRIIAIVLSILFIISLCFSANAAEKNINLLGNKVVFEFDGWAYEKINTYGYEIDEYLGNDSEVNLPWSFGKEYVTSIGDYAFRNKSCITSIDTTSVIESIGSYTFDGCTNLSKIVLYDSLTTMGMACFYGDTGLKSVNLLDTAITAVPAYCFAESGIPQMSLPATCESIGNYAFYNCSHLMRITIPDSVTSISDTAFDGCGNNMMIICSDDSYAAQFAQNKGINHIAPENFVIGDANGDKNVTIRDVTYIQLYLVNLYTLEGNTVYSADVNADGKVNIRDATYIQMYRAGMISGFDNIT